MQKQLSPVLIGSQYYGQYYFTITEQNKTEIYLYANFFSFIRL